MLRLKNLFLPVAFAFAAVLLIVGCTEPVEDEDTTPIARTATIVNGTMKSDSGNPTTVTNGTMQFLYAGDIITLTAETKPGQTFKQWSTSPTVPDNSFTSNDRTVAYTNFRMPEFDVTITADYNPITYAVSIVSGTFAAGGGTTTNLSTAGTAGITANTYPGQIFKGWTVSPFNAGTFDNASSQSTIFRMASPATGTAVTITANYNVNGETHVKFTWEAAESENIEYIFASVADVATWKTDTYDDLSIPREDFTAIPLNGGNPGVNETIFSFRQAPPYLYKGHSFSTTAGSFTAVCGVEDSNFIPANYFDIVANYTITVDPATAEKDGDDRWFEVAFDVGTILAGEDDLGWFDEIWLNDDNNRLNSPAIRSAAASSLSKYLNPLKKKPAIKKLNTVKQETKSGTIETTYYVIRRAK